MEEDCDGSPVEDNVEEVAFEASEDRVLASSSWVEGEARSVRRLKAGRGYEEDGG